MNGTDASNKHRSLPVVDRRIQVPNGRRAGLATGLRAAIVLFIAAGLRLAAQHQSDDAIANTSVVERTEEISQAIRSVSGIGESARVQAPDAQGNYPIADDLQSNASEGTIGIALTSMPLAKDVIGYRGASDCVVVLEKDWRILGVRLLDSQDTPEHVKAIKDSPAFFAQFEGRSFKSLDARDLDAVSGATLTSLAIVEGILVRAGQDKPSLRFPQELTLDEMEASLGQPVELVDTQGAFSGLFKTKDGLVTMLRTGTLVEEVVGYQGPSELRMVIDANDVVLQAALRSSFDNEPYVDYVKTDKYFWKTFLGKSLSELSRLDLEEAGIEGVSGATMTSTAAAETMVLAAARYLQYRAAQADRSSNAVNHWPRLFAADYGTLAVLVGAMSIGFTSWRGQPMIRFGWNLVLVGYFGLVTGNLLSQTVLMGWASRGVAWKLAPGLAAVVAISFLLSATTKHNLYCSHVCPHGAAQQLLRNRIKLRKRIPSSYLRNATWIPGALLCFCVSATALGLSINLSALEPFNAYVWYLSGFASIALALISLAVSAVLPMAYCRFGCPTGRLLDYLRHNARADRIQFADGVALLLAVAVWWIALGR